MFGSNKSKFEFLNISSVKEHELVNDASAILHLISGYIDGINSRMLILENISGVSLSPQQLKAMQEILVTIGHFQTLPAHLDYHVKILSDVLRNEKKAKKTPSYTMNDVIDKRENLLYRKQHELYAKFVTYTEKLKEWVAIALDVKTTIEKHVPMKTVVGNDAIKGLRGQIVRLKGAAKMDFVTIGREILAELEAVAVNLEQLSQESRPHAA